ncbi:MAG: TraR/DksA C4-type zinc finger protein [Pseudomonadota bacterium]
MPDWSDMAARLAARRNELAAALAEIEDALDNPQPKDWEDRSSERQGDEVLEARGHQELTELRQIDAAMGRIKAGEYGICTLCGTAISPARLSALPATPICKACAGARPHT